MQNYKKIVIDEVFHWFMSNILQSVTDCLWPNISRSVQWQNLKAMNL